jgi:type II secretory pathway pseudopilin PulG
MKWSAAVRGRAAGVRGFAMLEGIVVLAVVLMLTGIAVPMIGGYMAEERRARAEAEVKILGAAVASFHKDVGVYPARSNAGVDNSRYVLLSGGVVPAANPFAAHHDFATWGMNATFGDTIDNHLLSNTPGGAAGGAYPLTGPNHWRGPYLAGASPLDPWGRPYIVNVISGWFQHATDYKRLYVLSAGPNGIVDTAAIATATSDIGGDDIGVILGQQR